MERVIDRKEYRRTSNDRDIVGEEQVEILQKKIRKFLLQSVGATSILLVISFLKFFHLTDALKNIEKLLKEPIKISSIQESGQILFEKATEYYVQLNDWVNYIINKEEMLFVQKSGDTNTQIKNNFSLISESGDTNNKILNEVIKYITSGDNITYEVAVEGMNQLLEDANYIKNNYKMINPVVGTVTSVFGVRNSENPIVSHYHSGLDIAANTGTQILAALEGEVIEATTDTYYGKYLKIQKDDITMIYAHCSKLLVKVGEKVKKGELIAYVGNTGNSTGPHLHFEVKYKNRLINPKDILNYEY